MVTEKTTNIVWARAAGRCQFRGCNEPLIDDYIAKKLNKKFGQVAHIVAESPDMVRGDAVLSPKLANDPTNLMLLCYKHHVMIDDRDTPDRFSVTLLHEMRDEHIARVDQQTAVSPNLASFPLFYGAKIGTQNAPFDYNVACSAMEPQRYPASTSAIELGIEKSLIEDSEATYWGFEPTNLEAQFNAQVQPRLARGEIKHLSVFALAPQPLLIQLGVLLGDIDAADIYQLHREPKGWKWADGDVIKFLENAPSPSTAQSVALKLAISATVDDTRIKKVLGDDVPIYSISACDPHNDIMRHPDSLIDFRQRMRRAFDRLKADHPEAKQIHIFPAAPVSVAVELGRVWMQKADLPLEIYDETRGEGFVSRLKID